MGRKSTAPLTDVAETCLWTLWSRSAEAMKIDSSFSDPLAVAMVGQIDYPFSERCGSPQQIIAMRAAAYDTVVSQYLRSHLDGTVVALAEGLQTSYWRLGRPNVRWVSVDLPEVVSLREALLPREQRITHVGGSAFELGWMDSVVGDQPPIITAEGLFMYFENEAVMELISECASRFPGGRLIFDGIPSWWLFCQKRIVKQQQLRLKSRPEMPMMRSAMSARDASCLLKQLNNVSYVREVSLPTGRGFSGAAHKAYYNSSLMPSRWRASIYEVIFDAP